MKATHNNNTENKNPSDLMKRLSDYNRKAMIISKTKNQEKDTKIKELEGEKNELMVE